MNRQHKVFTVCLAVLLLGWASGFAADNVITITVPSHITPNYKDLFPTVQKFADRVNELGKGKVKVDLRHSESLFKMKEIVPALMNGACEMAFHSSLNITDTWPEIGGISLPFLYKDEADCQHRWASGKPVFDLVNKEMYRKYGIRILAGGIVKGITILTRGKAIEKPDDLKGLKIRSMGKTDGEFFKACGASLASLSSSQLQEALKVGMIDGIATYPDTVIARKLDDVLGCFVEMKPVFSIVGYQIYVLNKTFDSWPKEVQDIILQAAEEYDREILSGSMEHYQKNVRPTLEKKMKFISPRPEDMEKFISLSKSAYDKWRGTVDKSFADKFIELSKAPLKP